MRTDLAKMETRDLKIWHELCLRHGRHFSSSHGLMKFIITSYDDADCGHLIADHIETLCIRDSNLSSLYTTKDFRFRNRYKWPWDCQKAIGKTLWILRDEFFVLGSNMTQLDSYNEAYIGGLGMTTNWAVNDLGDIEC